jgi:D-methionine transport system ATP-binding protein
LTEDQFIPTNGARFLIIVFIFYSCEVRMIQIDCISKQYKTPQGIVQALDGVSFTVLAGEIFAIIGMSGAGKSTLLKILTGLETVDKGNVHLVGEDVATLDESAWRRLRRRIGVVFQGYNLLMQRTVRQNIAFPLEIAGWENKAIEERVDELLLKVGLIDKKHQFPKTLSGGQLQRVAIARALAARPEVLLLDEPTSALDSLTTDEIIELIRKLNREEALTVIVISHDIGVVRRLSDRVLVLDRGSVAEIESTSSVYEHPKALVTKRLLGRG